jgi:3-hydroxyacyl-CoA dehydrogenase/enoyl-CoA hydratase/3-hydroxybutyryl-CoA epimerase
MVEDVDRRGKRFGKGFYDYPKDGKKRLWPGLADHFPVRDEQPDVQELRKRFLTIQALESARCLEEGVLTDAADGDVGSIFGIGYPAWTGGTLSYIDTVGIGEFVAECDRLAESCGDRFQVSDWLRERARNDQAFYS